MQCHPRARTHAPLPFTSFSFPSLLSTSALLQRRPLPVALCDDRHDRTRLLRCADHALLWRKECLYVTPPFCCNEKEYDKGEGGANEQPSVKKFEFSNALNNNVKCVGADERGRGCVVTSRPPIAWFRGGRRQRRLHPTTMWCARAGTETAGIRRRRRRL